MKATHLLGVLFILSSVNGYTLTREKRDVDFITGTCDSTQTKIQTRIIHTTNFTKCPISTLVSRYFEPFLEECAHWMGEKPNYVASSNVFYCLEDPATGGVYIKATICCLGTLPDNTCIVCTSTDPEQCDYSQGAVVTCAPDEMCETMAICNNSRIYATIYKSCVKTCHSPPSCNLKNALLSGDHCADCCNTPLCNKGGRSIYCYPECNCPDMVAGNYYCSAFGDCICKDGCHGTHCENCTTTCNPNPCKNLGICQLNGTGITCCCRPGFGGQYCENYLPSCNRSLCYDHGECVTNGNKIQCICDPGYYGTTCEKISDEFNCPSSKNVYFNNPTPYIAQCSLVINSRLSKRAELSACRYYMKSQYNSDRLFEEGKDGHVPEVTDVGYNYCQDGDCGFAFYQVKVCCPSCFSNPCQNGGYCIQTEQNGTNEDYVCRCKFGFTGKYCEKRVQTCFVFGEPHYITFDGKFITHQGVCRYVLAEYSGDDLTPFIVYLKNEYRNDDMTISYPSYIEAEIFGYNVQLGRNNVVLIKQGNQTFQQVSLNVAYDHFTVQTSGRFVRLQTDFGLVVQYDGYNMMFVQISDDYRNLLTGICNSMDGNQDNDLVDRAGIMQSDDEKGHTAYIESFVTEGENVMNCSIESEQCNTTIYVSNEWCGYIIDLTGPLADCYTPAALLDFEACKYDVCRDPSIKCSALESFVDRCYQSGRFPDSDWRNITGCPMDCPPNSHYVFMGSACQPTCDDPYANNVCGYQETEVCECDEGYILRDGKCILYEDCGCKDGNVYYQLGEMWDPNYQTCLVKICSRCDSCLPPGVVEIVPILPVDGNWSEWSEWSDCTPEDVIKTRNRTCDNPAPLCNGDLCEGESFEVEACSTETTINPSPVTTTPKEISTPCSVGDIQSKCHECDLTRNPNMYIENPCGCESYFQCVPNGYGGYNVIEMWCSYCTCWNQAILTCDHDLLQRNKNSDKCHETTASPEQVAQTADFCTVTSSGYIRHFRAVSGDSTHYIDIDAGEITMPCPAGTVFSVVECRCVFGYNPLPQREFMCLDFNDLSNPYKTSTGLWVSPSATGLYPGQPGIEGYGLRFDGGNIEVPAFNNKEIRHLTVSLWFKRDRPLWNDSQALVSNDDCLNHEPTMLILSESPTEVGAGLKTTLLNILSAPLFTNVANDMNWHHLALTYDSNSQNAAFYLDGALKKTASVQGILQTPHCPLLIGSMYSSKFFHGVMDQICFYDQALSAIQVDNLYSDYSP